MPTRVYTSHPLADLYNGRKRNGGRLGLRDRTMVRLWSMGADRAKCSPWATGYNDAFEQAPPMHAKDDIVTSRRVTVPDPIPAPRGAGERSGT